MRLATFSLFMLEEMKKNEDNENEEKTPSEENENENDNVECLLVKNYQLTNGDAINGFMSKNASHINSESANGSSGKNYENSTNKKKKNEDLANICFLLFLYVLQGIPAGLQISIPLILSSRKVSYADQGTFSFASWPISLKLLWAPLVDSVYFVRIGIP
jgi:hypothetical protein